MYQSSNVFYWIADSSVNS